MPVKTIETKVYCGHCQCVHELSVPESAYRRLVGMWNGFNLNACVKELKGELTKREINLILFQRCI